jgi:hypothetical protein
MFSFGATQQKTQYVYPSILEQLETQLLDLGVVVNNDIGLLGPEGFIARHQISFEIASSTIKNLIAQIQSLRKVEIQNTATLLGNSYFQNSQITGNIQNLAYQRSDSDEVQVIVDEIQKMQDRSDSSINSLRAFIGQLGITKNKAENALTQLSDKLNRMVQSNEALRAFLTDFQEQLLDESSINVKQARDAASSLNRKLSDLGVGKFDISTSGISYDIPPIVQTRQTFVDSHRQQQEAALLQQQQAQQLRQQQLQQQAAQAQQQAAQQQAAQAQQQAAQAQQQAQQLQQAPTKIGNVLDNLKNASSVVGNMIGQRPSASAQTQTGQPAVIQGLSPVSSPTSLIGTSSKESEEFRKGVEEGKSAVAALRAKKRQGNVQQTARATNSTSADNAALLATLMQQNDAATAEVRRQLGGKVLNGGTLPQEDIIEYNKIFQKQKSLKISLLKAIDIKKKLIELLKKMGKDYRQYEVELTEFKGYLISCDETLNDILNELREDGQQIDTAFYKVDFTQNAAAQTNATSTSASSQGVSSSTGSQSDYHSSEMGTGVTESFNVGTNTPYTGTPTQTGGWLKLIKAIDVTEELTYSKYSELLNKMNEIIEKHTKTKIVYGIDDPKGKTIKSAIIKLEELNENKNDKEYWEPRSQIINVFLSMITVLMEVFSKYIKLSIGSHPFNEFQQIFFNNLYNIGKELRIPASEVPNDLSTKNEDNLVSPDRLEWITTMLNFAYIRKDIFPDLFEFLDSRYRKTAKKDFPYSPVNDYKTKMEALLQTDLAIKIPDYHISDTIYIEDIKTLIYDCLQSGFGVNKSSLFNFYKNGGLPEQDASENIKKIINLIDKIVDNIEEVSNLIYLINTNLEASKFKSLVDSIIKRRNENTVITYVKFRNDETIPIGENRKKLPYDLFGIVEDGEKVDLNDIAAYLDENGKAIDENSFPEYNRRFDVKINGNILTPYSMLDTVLLQYNIDNIPYYTTDTGTDNIKRFKFHKDFKEHLKENPTKFKISQADEDEKLESIARLNVTNYDRQFVFGKFTKVFLPYMDNISAAQEMNSILNCLENDKTVFLLGYGASGAGKTSSLIYFNKTKEPGILIHLCKNLCLDKRFNVTEINVASEEFYVDHSDKENKVKERLLNGDLTPLSDPKSTRSPLTGYIKFKYDTVKEDIILSSKYTHSKVHDYRLKPCVKVPKGTIGKDEEDCTGYPSGDGSSGDFQVDVTTLGQLMIYLIDSDRFVKATTNNPNSSRSHTLIYVKMKGKSPDSDGKLVDKDFNLIVGDFAGVENVFMCNDIAIKKGFASVQRDDDEKKPFYSTEDLSDPVHAHESSETATKDEVPWGQKGGSRFTDVCNVDEYRLVKETQNLYNFDESMLNVRKYAKEAIVRSEPPLSPPVSIQESLDNFIGPEPKDPKDSAWGKRGTIYTTYLNIIIRSVFEGLNANDVLKKNTRLVVSDFITNKDKIKNNLIALKQLKDNLENTEMKKIGQIPTKYIEILMKDSDDYNNTYAFSIIARNTKLALDTGEESLQIIFENLKQSVKNIDEPKLASDLEAAKQKIDGLLGELVDLKKSISYDKTNNKIIGSIGTLGNNYNSEAERLYTDKNEIIEAAKTEEARLLSKKITELGELKLSKSINTGIYNTRTYGSGKNYRVIQEPIFKTIYPLVCSSISEEGICTQNRTNYNDSEVTYNYTNYIKPIEDKINPLIATQKQIIIDTESDYIKAIGILKQEFEGKRIEENKNKRREDKKATENFQIAILAKFTEFYNTNILRNMGKLQKLTVPSVNREDLTTSQNGIDTFINNLSDTLASVKENLSINARQLQEFWDEINKINIQIEDLNPTIYSEILAKQPKHLTEDSLYPWVQITDKLKDVSIVLKSVLEAFVDKKFNQKEQERFNDFIYLQAIINGYEIDIDPSGTQSVPVKSDKINENSIQNMIEQFDLFYTIATDLFVETTCRLEQAENVCNNRKIEGFFINDSLSKMREDIQTILIKKSEIYKIALEPDYVNPLCEKFYCKPAPGSTKCRDLKGTGTEKLKSKIFNSICKEIFANKQEELYKKLVMAVFCVVNISRDMRNITTNNPPPIPYIDGNSLVYMLNNDKIFFNESEDSSSPISPFKRKFVEIIDMIENSYGQRLKALISSPIYQEGKEVMLSVNNLTFNTDKKRIEYRYELGPSEPKLPKNLDELLPETPEETVKQVIERREKLEDIKNRIQKIVNNGSSEFDKTFNAISGVNTESLTREDLQNKLNNFTVSKLKLKRFLTLIDNSNAASTIGTLEFVDRLAKFNTSDVICGTDIEYDPAQKSQIISSYEKMASKDNTTDMFIDVIKLCPVIAKIQALAKKAGGKISIKNKKITKSTSKKNKAVKKPTKKTKETKSSSTVEKKKKKTKNTK